MPITITAEAAARKSFGINISPGLGSAWNGDLKRILSVLFTTRVANIPWLPDGWLAGVEDLQEKFPNDLVRIAPAMGSIHPNTDMPGWVLASQERMDVWQAIWKASDDAIQSFAKGKQQEGRAQLDALIARADFWDAAYNLAVNIRDAVPNAGSFILRNLWNGLGWKWKLVIGFAGSAAVVWYLPKIKSLARAFGAR